MKITHHKLRYIDKKMSSWSESNLTEAEKRQITELVNKDMASGEISKYSLKKGNSMPHMDKQECEAWIKGVHVQAMRCGLHSMGFSETQIETELPEIPQSAFVDFLNKNPELLEEFGLMKCCRQVVNIQALDVESHTHKWIRDGVASWNTKPRFSGSDSSTADGTQYQKLSPNSLAKGPIESKKQKKQYFKGLKQSNKAEKKAKNVAILEGDRQAPYDIDKVLQELGELDNNISNARENSKKKGKKSKKKQNQQNDNEVVANSLANGPNDSKILKNVLDHPIESTKRGTTPINTAEINRIEVVKNSTDNSRKNNNAIPEKETQNIKKKGDSTSPKQNKSDDKLTDQEKEEIMQEKLLQQLWDLQLRQKQKLEKNFWAGKKKEIEQLIKSSDNKVQSLLGKSEPETSTSEKTKTYSHKQYSTNEPKIPINNTVDYSTSILEAGNVSNKKEETNVPKEVLEYLENIERENQKHKEALGFMETLIKKYENLNIQYQKQELQIQTLKVQNLNFENKNNNLEVQTKYFEDQTKYLEDQAKNLEEGCLCKICMENEISIAFIPCGHLMTCENCAVNGDLKICPMCRKLITKHLKTYLS